MRAIRTEEMSDSENPAWGLGSQTLATQASSTGRRNLTGKFCNACIHRSVAEAPAEGDYGFGRFFQYFRAISGVNIARSLIYSYDLRFQDNEFNGLSIQIAK